jgi:hypothetical protein
MGATSQLTIAQRDADKEIAEISRVLKYFNTSPLNF